MAAPEELPSDQRAAAIGERFQELSDECEAILLAAIAGGAIGTVAGLAKARADVAAAVQKFQAETLQVTGDVIRQAYIDASNKALTELAEQLKTKQGATITVKELAANIQSKTETQVVQLLTENATTRLADASVSIGRRVDDGLRKAALEEIAKGTARGDTVKQTADRLTDELARRGLINTDQKGAKLVRVVGKDGVARNYQAGKYAEMVVRTTGAEAHSEAVLRRVSESGRDLVAVSTHKDTDGQDICNEYEGKVFSISGEDNQYPVLPLYPPFHPNCRHLLSPFVPRLA